MSGLSNTAGLINGTPLGRGNDASHFNYLLFDAGVYVVCWDFMPSKATQFLGYETSKQVILRIVHLSSQVGRLFSYTAVTRCRPPHSSFEFVMKGSAVPNLRTPEAWHANCR